MPAPPKTRAVTFRLGDEIEALLRALGERLGGLDNSAVVRLAVRRLADAELGASAGAKNKGRK